MNNQPIPETVQPDPYEELYAIERTAMKAHDRAVDMAVRFGGIAVQYEDAKKALDQANRECEVAVMKLTQYKREKGQV